MVFPLLVICDVGPDPDDMKALLLAAVLHRLRECRLTIVANGGQQPRERAKLALCVLDRLGISDVAVGVGSQGKAYVAKPHEYRLDGYERTSDSRLVEDGDALILSVLRAARAKTVRVVCISSLRDIANALSAQPNLVLAKVRVLAIQGGLERDEHGAWRPDQAVNNGFDPEAADRVYRFCFERGLPLNVVSRFAVPVLPMQVRDSVLAPPTQRRSSARARTRVSRPAHARRVRRSAAARQELRHAHELPGDALLGLSLIHI